jgi:sirohydrochlorin ferrochelatase
MNMWVLTQLLMLLSASNVGKSFLIGSSLAQTSHLPNVMKSDDKCNNSNNNDYEKRTWKRRKQWKAYSNKELKRDGDEPQSEPDLFEYFDPLLSPHSYPKGILPKSTSSPESEKSSSNSDISSALKARDEGTDFDALAPPTNSDDMGWGNRESNSGLKKSYILKKPFGITIPSAEEENQELAPSSITSSVVSRGLDTSERRVVDTTATFDPTLSPHLYRNGNVPKVIVGDENTIYVDNQDGNGNIRPSQQQRRTIGLLLMDHGSRSETSNQRLHELARLYQDQFSEEFNDASTKSESAPRAKVIVKAAHMEIAAPSIQDGLASLIEANVDEIVCHPYFLSPGRHVVEDIPRIVAEAIGNLSITVPVRTTPPIGSETNIMIQAINSLVKETSELYK